MNCKEPRTLVREFSHATGDSGRAGEPAPLRTPKNPLQIRSISHMSHHPHSAISTQSEITSGRNASPSSDCGTLSGWPLSLQSLLSLIDTRSRICRVPRRTQINSADPNSRAPLLFNHSSFQLLIREHAVVCDQSRIPTQSPPRIRTCMQCLPIVRAFVRDVLSALPSDAISSPRSHTSTRIRAATHLPDPDTHSSALSRPHCQRIGQLAATLISRLIPRPVPPPHPNQ